MLLLRLPMRKPTQLQVAVPPFSKSLFPYREFPAWKAVARAFELISRASSQLPRRATLARLERPLVGASQRIVAVADGGLPPHRWHRRVCSALAYLQRAANAVPPYERSGALTRRQGDELLDAIIDACEHLSAAVVQAEIPDELRAPSRSAGPSRVLH
ncbi:MAG: hypothetical protein JWN44_1895 [Myxococcales bacterium]|nr:hypothetical protein [Myxococcales bacterium]